MTGVSSRKRFKEYRANRPSEPAAPGHGQPAPSRKTSSHRSFVTLFVAFVGLLRGFRLTLALALASLTIATMLKLLPPLGIKLVIDYVVGDQVIPAPWADRLPTNRLTLLFLVGTAIIALSIVATLVHLWGRWRATKIVNQVQVSLRKRAFEHAVRLPLHRVYDLKSGGAASLLREDASGAAELIFSMINKPWRAIIQLLGSLVVLAVVEWRMMAAGIAMVPLVFVTHRTWVGRIRPMYRDVRKQRQDIDSHSTEAFGGMRVVRAFTRERSERGRFVMGNHFLVRQQLFVWWWARMIEVIWDLLIPVASTSLLVYGGYQIMQGQMTFGDLTMFLFYLAMLLEPLATLAGSATSFQNQLAGLDRVLDLLDEPNELTLDADVRPIDIDQIAGNVTFSGLGFHYPNSQQVVLSDVTLNVPAGTTCALVGRSGAGKTTLCNLVARFYDPTSGRIELDGVDLRQIPLDTYRGLLGIVEQDVFLFDGTIADNIAYAVSACDQEDVEQAARSANAHEFIVGLENGYDTIIGERGVKLSGGQRQRLAIARAILADPQILILDEATSNLDSESERLIQQSLRILLQNRTCFIIAHRLSTIAHADQIVVLEDGRIVERGSHDELMAQSGHYRGMVELQTEPPRSTEPLVESN